MKRTIILVLLAVLLIASIGPAFAGIVKKNVAAGSVGEGSSGATVVAQRGAVVYARKGSNVQYWPGSKLVPVSQAAGALPDCSAVSVRASGSNEELIVESGGKACTVGDTAVVAFEGATVIYDDTVPLIRRPVNRR